MSGDHGGGGRGGFFLLRERGGGTKASHITPRRGRADVITGACTTVGGGAVGCAGGGVAAVGALCFGAGVGDCAGGLQRGWGCVELSDARHGAIEGVSVGGGRAGGDLRSVSGLVFCD